MNSQQQQQMLMQQQQMQQQQQPRPSSSSATSTPQTAYAQPSSSTASGGGSGSSSGAPNFYQDPNGWFAYKNQQLMAIHQHIKEHRQRFAQIEAAHQPPTPQSHQALVQIKQTVQQLQAQQQHIQQQMQHAQQQMQQAVNATASSSSSANNNNNYSQQQQQQQMMVMAQQQASANRPSSSTQQQQQMQQQQQGMSGGAAAPQPSSQQQQAAQPQRFGPYIVGETIGRGSFGKVKIAIHETTGVKVALKVIPRKSIEADARSQLKLQREIRVLRLLKHPHIMRLYDVVQTRLDIVLVLELVSGGELFVYLARRGRLEESHARMFFQQIIASVAHCHNAGVVHRDIKPENILVESSHRGVKLGDFGLSSISYDGKVFETSCGTPNYAAPEVVGGRVYVGKEADIWSTGVVLFTMVTGTLPFDDEQLSMLFKKIQTANYTMPSFLSPLAQDLIRKILVVNPLDRATTGQILNHPWVRDSFPPYLALLHGEALAENHIYPAKYNNNNSMNGMSGSPSLASSNHSFANAAAASISSAVPSMAVPGSTAKGSAEGSAATSINGNPLPITSNGASSSSHPSAHQAGGDGAAYANSNSNSANAAASGDYYLTEAAKLNGLLGSSGAGAEGEGAAVSNNNTNTNTAADSSATANEEKGNEGAGDAQQQQQQQVIDLQASAEQLKKRDAYRNVIDMSIVVQLAERFRTSSRKITDQLIANPAGQYALNVVDPRHTLVDKKVADSVIVTIPNADQALRSESHDMCISYSILLDKKRNAELNAYKKKSAQWANQTPVATFSENSAAAVAMADGGGNGGANNGGAAAPPLLLQPNEIMAQTQAPIDARRAAQMVAENSPEAKARMGAHHGLGTYRSTATPTSSVTTTPQQGAQQKSPNNNNNNNLSSSSYAGGGGTNNSTLLLAASAAAAAGPNAGSYNGNSSGQQFHVDPMSSIPASYGWGGVSHFNAPPSSSLSMAANGGGGGGFSYGIGGTSYSPAAGTFQQQQQQQGMGGNGLLLNAAQQQQQQYLLSPAGPGPQRTAHVFSMGAGAMSLNPATFGSYQGGGGRSYAAQQQLLQQNNAAAAGQGVAAGGALVGLAAANAVGVDPLDERFATSSQQQGFVDVPPAGFVTNIIPITDANYLKTYNSIMLPKVFVPPVTTRAAWEEAAEKKKRDDEEEERRRRLKAQPEAPGAAAVGERGGQQQQQRRSSSSAVIVSGVDLGMGLAARPSPPPPAQVQQQPAAPTDHNASSVTLSLMGIGGPSPNPSRTDNNNNPNDNNNNNPNDNNNNNPSASWRHMAVAHHNSNTNNHEGTTSVGSAATLETPTTANDTAAQTTNFSDAIAKEEEAAAAEGSSGNKKKEEEEHHSQQHHQEEENELQREPTLATVATDDGDPAARASKHIDPAATFDSFGSGGGGGGGGSGGAIENIVGVSGQGGGEGGDGTSCSISPLASPPPPLFAGLQGEGGVGVGKDGQQPAPKVSAAIAFLKASDAEGSSDGHYNRQTANNNTNDSNSNNNPLCNNNNHDNTNNSPANNTNDNSCATLLSTTCVKSPSLLSTSAPRRMRNKMALATSTVLSGAGGAVTVGGGGGGGADGAGGGQSMNNSLSHRPLLPPPTIPPALASPSPNPQNSNTLGPAAGSAFGAPSPSNQQQQQQQEQQPDDQPLRLSDNALRLFDHAKSNKNNQNINNIVVNSNKGPAYSHFHNGVYFKHCGKAEDLMTIVYDGLVLHGFLWKVTRPFQLAAITNCPIPIKLFVRLFRTIERQSEYIIDVRLSTHCVASFAAVDVASELVLHFVKVADSMAAAAAAVNSNSNNNHSFHSNSTPSEANTSPSPSAAVVVVNSHPAYISSGMRQWNGVPRLTVLSPEEQQQQHASSLPPFSIQQGGGGGGEQPLVSAVQAEYHSAVSSASSPQQQQQQQHNIAQQMGSTLPFGSTPASLLQ